MNFQNCVGLTLLDGSMIVRAFALQPDGSWELVPKMTFLEGIEVGVEDEELDAAACRAWDRRVHDIQKLKGKRK